MHVPWIFLKSTVRSHPCHGQVHDFIEAIMRMKPGAPKMGALSSTDIEAPNMNQIKVGYNMIPLIHNGFSILILLYSDIDNR